MTEKEKRELRAQWMRDIGEVLQIKPSSPDWDHYQRLLADAEAAVVELDDPAAAEVRRRLIPEF